MSTPVQLTAWVEMAALALEQRHDLAEIEAWLVEQGGVPTSLAERLVLLIPIAPPAA